MGCKNSYNGKNERLVEQKFEKDNGKDKKIRNSRLCRGLNVSIGVKEDGTKLVLVMPPI